jgi:phage terminase large subunit-like protein
MVRSTIHAVDPEIRVEKIRASISKQSRAEPVSAMYERGMIHHAGFMPLLEAQMVSWVPNLSKSPDRLDALVHGVTFLLPTMSTFKSSVMSPVNRRI